MKQAVKRFIPSRLRHTTAIIKVILWVLRVSIAGGIVWALLIGNWEAFSISILALLLTFTPDIIERKYHFVLPIEFHGIIVVFMYMSLFLGSGYDAYEKYFWWDAVLHTVSGIVLSFAGFLILYVLHQQGKLKASPAIIAFFTFCTGVALGGVWEIYEFTIDSVFGTNMQRTGLSDTMWDLIVDAVGALAISAAAYRIVSKGGNSRGLVYRALERFFDDNPDLRKRHWWSRR